MSHTVVTSPARTLVEAITSTDDAARVDRSDADDDDDDDDLDRSDHSSYSSEDSGGSRGGGSERVGKGGGRSSERRRRRSRGGVKSASTPSSPARHHHHRRHRHRHRPHLAAAETQTPGPSSPAVQRSPVEAVALNAGVSSSPIHRDLLDLSTHSDDLLESTPLGGDSGSAAARLEGLVWRREERMTRRASNVSWVDVSSIAEEDMSQEKAPLFIGVTAPARASATRRGFSDGA